MINGLIDGYEEWTRRWDARAETAAPAAPAGTEFLGLCRLLHHCNYRIWDQEDLARRSDLDYETLVAVKRRIDRLNQERNDTIERLDEWLLQNAYPGLEQRELPLRTETPGSCCDRLSVLCLKTIRMREQTLRGDATPEHRAACADKLRVLERQRRDLLEALEEYFADLAAGRVGLRVYRQFKMYNDPHLNPQLYGQRRERGAAPSAIPRPEAD